MHEDNTQAVPTECNLHVPVAVWWPSTFTCVTVTIVSWYVGFASGAGSGPSGCRATAQTQTTQGQQKQQQQLHGVKPTRSHTGECCLLNCSLVWPRTTVSLTDSRIHEQYLWMQPVMLSAAAFVTNADSTGIHREHLHKGRWLACLCKHSCLLYPTPAPVVQSSGC